MWLRFIMTIANFQPNRQFSFQDWPSTTIPYKKKFTKSCVSLELTDAKTQKNFSIAVERTALHKAGLSLVDWKQTQSDPVHLCNLICNASLIEQLLQKARPVVAKHLAPNYLKFFTHIPDANRAINRAIYRRKLHQSGTKGTPGIYITASDSAEVFMNLKGTTPLGFGAFGKVKKSLWLTAEEKPEIVAKKVIKRPDSIADRTIFINEIAALKEFKNQRGIISLIDGGIYDDKLAIFLPLYECNLDTFYTNSMMLEMDELISAISQWLDGLAKIAEKGIHGDLSDRNLLLKKIGDNKIEAVIADLGAFCFHGREKRQRCTPAFAPPEYYAEKKVTEKQDVWGMGLCLYQIFTHEWLPCFVMEKEKIPKWTSELKPGWVLEYLPDDEPPPFLLPLLSYMLHPDPELRLSAKEASERFTAGWAAYRASSPVESKRD